MPEVQGPETAGDSVDRAARVGQAEFPPSAGAQLRREDPQSDRRVLHVCRVVLVHHNHVVAEDADSAAAGAASPKLATQALLPGDPDVHAVVLPSSDVPSDSGGGLYQLDHRDGAEDRPRGTVPEASAVEPAADHLAVRQEDSGLVGGGRRRAGAQDRQRDRRDRGGDPVDGHRGRPEGVLQALDRQRTGRRVRDRQVREPARDLPAEPRGPRDPVPRVAHPNAVVQRRPHRDTAGESPPDRTSSPS